MNYPRWTGVVFIGVLATLLVLLAGVQAARAVPSPGSIRWKGTPTAFVDSLYRGVLGRAPETRAVVTGWAQQVNSTAASRWRLFWIFVGTTEYKKSRYAHYRKEYYVYRRTKINSRYYEYFAAKRTSKGQMLKGPYTYGVAAAVVGYYRAFYPKW